MLLADDDREAELPTELELARIDADDELRALLEEAALAEECPMELERPPELAEERDAETDDAEALERDAEADAELLAREEEEDEARTLLADAEWELEAELLAREALEAETELRTLLEEWGTEIDDDAELLEREAELLKCEDDDDARTLLADDERATDAELELAWADVEDVCDEEVDDATVEHHETRVDRRYFRNIVQECFQMN
ncbi:hypothetical protein FB45DRAFT_1017439 [Roridomyces roridus]|uniref:Uncharacterized protein n=1 Tax=Roridomyces roridus TaxID=1738132 RepID=A0AAD7CIF3_9AGAR|nr:hypothetical protein FB45DRAFT_1017439 [Roridomyces roridus]